MYTKTLTKRSAPPEWAGMKILVTNKDMKQMLKRFDPNQKGIWDTLLYSKVGCPLCAKYSDDWAEGQGPSCPRCPFDQFRATGGSEIGCYTFIKKILGYRTNTMDCAMHVACIKATSNIQVNLIRDIHKFLKSFKKERKS